MSRCFPFPPPGYEKKARTDDVDLLKKEKEKEKEKEKKEKEKEKEKEKKHKKEKKDKEKRQSKEKKEKDRSDGKHKDKKDKKEKHKDKKKERDRDKEKDRSNNSEEKKLPGHPEGQNGEKTSDEKKLPGKSEGHGGEKFIQKEKVRDKDRSSFSGEKKLTGQFSGYNGDKISQNSHLAKDSRDSKFVQELGSRVRGEGAGAGNQLVDKLKKDEGMVRLVARSTANTLAEEKEKNKKSDDRKLDVQGIKDETRSGGNVVVQNLAGAVKARAEGIPRQVDSNAEKQDEGKGKTKEKGSDDKIRDKRKDRDREKKSHGKDKDRDKEKKEKAKAKGEYRNLEQDNLKGSNKDDPVGSVNLITSHPSKEGNKDVAEGNHRKRKDLEINGFFHVNDIKPNKLPRTSSSYPLMNNGKILESCQAPAPIASDSKGAGTGLKVDNKERKVNGIIEAQLLSLSPTKHLSASAQASLTDDEVSVKPPHPDSKYLSKVLSVPKMEEWSEIDDQSWLFHSNESQTKKTKLGFSEFDEAPQVWAEALQIESADICALPYVIPY